MAKKILIVDDETDICDILENVLTDEGYTTQSVNSSEDAIAAIRNQRPQLIILDIWLEGSKMDGLQLLEKVKREYPNIQIVMISGHGSIEAAVTAIKRGAYDFIEKPFKTEKLKLVVARAFKDIDQQREIETLRLYGDKETELIGESAAIQSVLSNISKIAPSNSRVLITGPQGSGKEVASRKIHNGSARASGPFVMVNFAMLRSDEMEVEIFGVEPNKQNADKHRKVGIFERAHGGTLFFDEIGDMPNNVQAKVLRILQDQSFKRIGGDSKISINVRVISSTNQNMPEMLESGRFREDLLYRLNVMELRMPSLSERREDIPFLAQYFMKKAAQSTGLPSRLLSPEVITAFQTYHWPGNVRQLKNVIEGLLIMAPGASHESIKAELLPPEFQGEPTPMLPANQNTHALELPLRDAREMFERTYLLTQVQRFGGNISRTAEFIGMERSALHRKLRSLNVDYNGKRAGDSSLDLDKNLATTPTGHIELKAS